MCLWNNLSRRKPFYSRLSKIEKVEISLHRILVPACLLIAFSICGAWEGNPAFGAENKKPAAKKSAPAKQSAAKSEKAAKTTPSNSAKAAENSATKDATPTNLPNATPPAATPSPGPGAGPLLLPDGTFTSLVVDATGFKLDRSMSPKILRPDGACVWGSLAKLTDEQYAIIQERGMVAYVKTVEEACANPRAGLRPLIVRATGTAGGKLCSDVVVAAPDAERILVENGKSKFLEAFNVIFVQNEASPNNDKPKSEESAAANDQTPDSTAGEKEGSAK